MGKGNKQTTTSQQTQQSSTAIDPTVQAQTYKNINDANAAAQNWQPAPIQGPAGFTPDQQSSFDATRAAGTAGQGAINSAVQGAQGAMGYQPSQVGGNGTVSPQMINGNFNYDPSLMQGTPGYQAAQAQAEGYGAVNAGPAQTYQADAATAAQLDRSKVRDVSAGSTLDQLPSYQDKFNGFSQGVIDSTLNDLNRARIMSMQNSDAQAARAGAFGSRRDLLDAETNRAFADAAARSSADIRQQGFQTGVNALQSDLGRQSQADLANQGADQNVYSANANLDQTTRLANLNASNAAKQYGADASNQVNLANQNAANQAAQFGAQASNQASQFNAGAKNDAGQFNSGLQFNANQANQNALNSAGQFNANLGLNQAQSNQNAWNNTAQFNAGQNQQAQQSNQQAGLAAANLGLGAAQTLGGLGQQQSNNAYTNAGALNQIGTQQQGYNQSVIDTANANAQNQANADLTRLGIQQSGMNGAVYGTSSTGSSNGTQTTVTQPSLGSSIGQMIGTGLQLGGAIASGGASLGLGGAAKLPGISSMPKGFSLSQMAPGIVSDQRLKKNIMRIGKPLDKVRKLNGVDYDWEGGGHDSGLIAQQVAKVAPTAEMNMGGGVKGYNPAPVLGLLVESVKQLDKKVNRKGITMGRARA